MNTYRFFVEVQIVIEADSEEIARARYAAMTQQQWADAVDGETLTEVVER